MPGVLHEAVRNPNLSLEPEDDDSIDLYRVVRGVWDARLLVLSSVAAAVLVGGAATLLLPKVYSATATVFATPPTFSTDLQPQPLGIEAYARLAESDLVRARLRVRLEEENFFTGPAKELELRTVLYSSREPQKPYLPLVGLVSEWGTPEGAQRIANTWAAILMEEQERITATSTESSVSFISKEYPRAAAAVATAEQEFADLKARHAAELSRARIELGVEPLGERGSGVFFEQQGTGGLALKILDTERGPKYASVRAQDQVVAALEAEIAKVRIDVESSKNRFAQLEAELKRTPQYLDGVVPRAEGAVGDSAERGAVPFVNPVYLMIAEQLASERVRYNSLMPAPASLNRELEAARATGARLRSELIASERQMGNVQREHSVREVLAMRRISETQAKFKPLEEKIGNAQIEAAQRDSDLQLGALAPLPSSPIRPRMFSNVLAAAGIGLMLGLVGAWIAHRANAEAA